MKYNLSCFTYYVNKNEISNYYCDIKGPDCTAKKMVNPVSLFDLILNDEEGNLMDVVTINVCQNCRDILAINLPEIKNRM